MRDLVFCILLVGPCNSSRCCIYTRPRSGRTEALLMCLLARNERDCLMIWGMHASLCRASYHSVVPDDFV